MSDFGQPQNTLSLLQQGGQAISQIPQNDFAHPLVEKYVRAITSGQMDSEQAHTAMLQELQAAQNPSIGAAPAQAGAPQGQPQQPLGPPPQAPIQAPPEKPRGDAPERPMPSAANEAPAPSGLLDAAKNQQMGAVTAAQPPMERTQVARTPAPAPAPAPIAPPTGAVAARQAIIGDEGGRMTNRDIGVLMDAWTRGGKSGLEREKEAGRNARSAAGRGVKLQIANMNNDTRMQRIQDQWDAEVANLDLKKQKEADDVAHEINQADLAAHKLNAMIAKSAASRGDKFDIEEMKLLAREVQTHQQNAARLGSSLQVEAPSVQGLIQITMDNAGQAQRNFQDFVNSRAQTHLGSETPAVQGAQGSQNPTVGEVNPGFKTVKLSAKTAQKAAAPTGMQAQKSYKPGDVVTSKDGKRKVKLSADGTRWESVP